MWALGPERSVRNWSSKFVGFIAGAKMQAAHRTAAQKANDDRQQTCGDQPMPIECPSPDQCNGYQSQAHLEAGRKGAFLLTGFRFVSLGWNAEFAHSTSFSAAFNLR